MAAIERAVERAIGNARAFLLGTAIDGRASSPTPYLSIGGDDFSPFEYGEYVYRSGAVYSCVNLRSNLLASLPLRLYRVQANGAKDVVTAGAALELLTKVNPYWTFSRLINMTEMSLGLWGQSFWALARNEAGTGPPREIWWMRPDKVRIQTDPTEYIKRIWYTPGQGADPIPFERGEFIWFRYPNPIDEFAGLSPLASARIAADSSIAAMHSNANLFRQGIQMGGLIVPRNGAVLSDDQAKDLERQIGAKFKGVGKAHRWGVLRFDAEFKPTQLSPKDAEFLGALKWGLEEICRAYGVPLDLVGGERTYENVAAAERAIWIRTIRPEAQFIAAELTEQLLPMFTGATDRADLAEFDLSDVEVLHEAETAEWDRWEKQIKTGAHTINEWRVDKGLDPVAWGDGQWVPPSPMSLGGGTIPPEGDVTSPDEPARGIRIQVSPHIDPDTILVALNDGFRKFNLDAIPATTIREHRSIPAYGSDDHRALMTRADKQAEPHETKIKRKVQDLFKAQRQSVMDALKSERAARSLESFANNPFDKKRWVRQFRTAIRPLIGDAVDDYGTAAAKDVGVPGAFKITEPAAARFIERRAQRFATLVNDTTWDMLRNSLSDGITDGESIDALAARVESVMGIRIESSAETIARTETIGAATGGTLEGWKSSGVVEKKVWLAALDDRTRDTHADAHGQEVGIDDDFEVGDATGPGPGMMDDPGEDCNCRCSMTAVVDVDTED